MAIRPIAKAKSSSSEGKFHNIAFKTRLKVNNKEASTFLNWCEVSRAAYNYGITMINLYLDCMESLRSKEGTLTYQDTMAFFENDAVRIKSFKTFISNIKSFFNVDCKPLGTVSASKFKGTGCAPDWIVDSVYPTGITREPFNWLKRAVDDVMFSKGKAIKPGKYASLMAKFGRLSPEYKRRGEQTSFCLETGNTRPDTNNPKRLITPKGNPDLRLCEAIPYSEFSIQNVSVSKEGQHWFASICLKIPASEFMTPRKENSDKPSVVGIDWGVKTYLTKSDGNKFEMPKRLAVLEKKYDAVNGKLQALHHENLMLVVKDCLRCQPLVTAIAHQKHLCQSCRSDFNARKRSRKSAKLRARIVKINLDIRNLREDKANFAVSHICRQYDIVGVELLNVTKMTKSNKGTVESPGINVKASSRRIRGNLGAIPYKTRQKFRHKRERDGGLLVEVNPAFTSQRCRKCGYVHRHNRMTQAEFKCRKCDHAENADFNSSKNVESMTLSVIDDAADALRAAKSANAVIDDAYLPISCDSHIHQDIAF